MTEWIIQFIERFSYLGIAVLMLLENIFPPVPSELIMPFAGFVAARGDLNPVGVVAAGLVGSLLGTLPWYWAGRRLGSARLKRFAERHGRWLTLDPEDLEQAEDRFRRHGARSVMIGRLIPAIRSVISMPAGIERMPLGAFLLWSAAGSLLWTGALAALGFALETRWDKVKDVVEIATRVVVGGLLAWYAWRVLTFGRKPRRT
ncbi:DedA family protein [Ramlibacter tataouinensis]|uniref:Candidate membrane protein n=1 Tax=Ramlibacter tataouinensis (strain ATCC BAA-407 / DSM 14655 / LMG 21543 / TTB310) TaxID=365046 RepID=F5XZP0_RAMTT|nr:DedA family protein [Ramlibacter tataouinensis]AEG92069.1 candidate membrane protein [Ramlibacter tataouinensis TTB310]